MRVGPCPAGWFAWASLKWALQNAPAFPDFSLRPYSALRSVRARTRLVADSLTLELARGSILAPGGLLHGSDGISHRRDRKRRRSKR